MSASAQPLSRGAADQRGQLAQVERETRRRAGAAESLANAVVALAAADGAALARGKHREAYPALIVIAAQVGEIDVHGFDLVTRGPGQRFERSERAGDRRSVRQPRPRPREHFLRRAVQGWQEDE